MGNKTDMLGKKCELCAGTFVEGSSYDDLDGTVTCSGCGAKAPRWNLLIVGRVCANCQGMCGDLAPGRDPEELCDTCYRGPSGIAHPSPPTRRGKATSELEQWQAEARREAIRANRAEDRFLRAEERYADLRALFLDMNKQCGSWGRSTPDSYGEGS